MATETKDILLRLKLEGDADIKKRNNELLKSIQDNQTAIALNNLKLKELGKEADKNAESIAKLTQENLIYTNANKGLRSELNNNIKVLANEVGSLNEKRATLNNMNAAYAKLSADQKTNTAEGIAQGAAIRKLTDELKAEEKALGDTRRNVGNYTDSIIEAGNQMGPFGGAISKVATNFQTFKASALAASGGTSVLNGAMKLLAANPIFAIIAIAAGIFMALKEAISKNAEIIDKFQQALVPLKVILGVVFGIIGDIAEFLVGGFAKGIELVTSLFGKSGAAVNEYTKALKEAQDAEDNLTNLRLRERIEQEKINNLMAVANNRMVEGKARYEAITEAIRMQIDLAKEQAANATKIFNGTVAELEAEYNLRGKLRDKNNLLTADGLKKLSDEDKQRYEDSLSNLLSFTDRESEIRKESGRKLGQIQGAIVASEKEQRDLQIAAMSDGLGKQLATIQSNYTAQKATVKISYQEQRIAIENELQKQIKLHKDNYAEQAKLALQFYSDIQDINKQEQEQQALIDAAQAREKLNAQRNAAKQAADSRISLERQIQDAVLATYEDGYNKERQALLLSFQRKREDLQREAEFTGKNRKETAELIKALTVQYNAEALKLETENQRKINELISGETLARREKELQLRLDTVKEGSKDELEAKIEALQLQKEAETAELLKVNGDTSLINAKFRQQEAELREQFEADSRQKLLDESLQRYQNEVEIARQAGEDTIELRIAAKKRELDNIQSLEGETNEQFIARRLELQAQLTDIEREGSQERTDIRNAEYQAAQSITDGLIALVDAFAGESSKQSGFLKALALFQIGLDTAQAISALTASSEANPANAVTFGAAGIVQFATGLARILTNIASAKKLLSGDTPQKKATGGLIVGPGTGTSDSIPTYLSNNESVLTAQSTGMFAPLLSGLNVAGGGIPIESVNRSQEIMGEQFLSNAFAKALSFMPAPVLDLQEFHRADDRLISITENAVK
jgi:hypothetical protein